MRFDFKKNLAQFSEQISSMKIQSGDEDLNKLKIVFRNESHRQIWVDVFSKRLDLLFINAEDKTREDALKAIMRNEIIRGIPAHAAANAYGMLVFLSESDHANYFKWVDPLDTGIIPRIFRDGIYEFAFSLYFTTIGKPFDSPSTYKAIMMRQLDIEISKIGLSAAAWKGVKVPSLMIDHKEQILSALKYSAIFDPISFHDEDLTHLSNQISKTQNTLKDCFGIS